MSDCCCNKEKFNARVAKFEAVNLSVSGIIAYLEELIREEGGAVVAQLPGLLAAAKVPASLIPLIVGIAAYLVSLVPAPVTPTPTPAT